MATTEQTRLQKWRTRLLLVLVTIVVGLGLLELASRWVFDHHGMHYGVEMWKYAKLLKRRSSNPEIGHEHKPNSQAILMGVPVEINSERLRDREFSQPKPSGVTRILVLGDSMTFGWGAAVEDTYSKVLERMLNDENGTESSPRIEVINAGVGNYNTVQEVAYFKAFGLAYDPDLVVLGFFINDAEPTPTPKGGFLARHSYLYVVASSAWDAIFRKLGDRKDRATYYSELYRDSQPGWSACRAALAELFTICRDRRIALTVLLIPELHSPAENYPFNAVHAEIKRLTAAANVPVVEAREVMPHKTPMSWWVSPGDAHPNADAHRFFAKALYAEFADKLRSSADPVSDREDKKSSREIIDRDGQ